MGNNWGESARQLIDWLHCPRCEAELVAAGWCTTCGAELSGPLGLQLVEASKRAAEAITMREVLIDRLPTRQAAPSLTPSVARAASNGAPDSAEASTPSANRAEFDSVARVTPSSAGAPASGSQISVQSVLAVAGAGLLAVAALVFTFLNPDLTSFAMRTTIIAVVTVLFAAGAWFFARRGLQFSAEAVGALAAVFAALDVWAFAQMAADGSGAWIFAGIGSFLGAAVLLLAGARTRIRTWTWAAVVGFALTPGFFGAAGGSPWSPLFGSVAVAIVVLVLHRVLRALEPGFGSILGAERGTATVLQIGAVALSLNQLIVIWLGVPGSESTRFLGFAGILAVLSTVAVIGSWNGLRRFWSFLAGSFAAAAVAILPVALGLPDRTWLLTLMPLAAGIALVVVSALRGTMAASRRSLLAGARTIALLSALPTVSLAVWILVSQIVSVNPAALGGPGSDRGFADAPQILGLAVVLGLAAVAVTSGAQAWVLRRSSGTIADAADGPTATARPTDVGDPAAAPVMDTSSRDMGARSEALWAAILSMLTLTAWSGFDRPVQSAVGLALAVGFTLLVVPGRPFVATETAVRRPLLIGAHLVLALAALIGWNEQATIVWVGVAAVLVLGVVSLAMPARWNPLYLGIGYAYSLIIFATALTLAHVESLAVLCLTATLALLVGLAVTLTRSLSPRSWYATLLVTAVPFLLGVVAVLLERSIWTALSTGFAFALALTLMITRRPGMTLLLRSASAALLVPSLAVVVVCLGAALFDTSGSPIVLPVIAAIVACTLPATDLIARALRRRGIAAVEADAARRWIELSIMVTAALAVLLALVRTAAGLNTTFLVLVILGAGAAASAFTTRRRYAWWAAAASWTGALWCVWAIQGIDVLEPYVLPPALAAVTVGVIFLARGREGAASFATALVATGLTVAVLPSIAVLAVSGPVGEVDSEVVAFPWRTYGLIGAAMLLVVFGAVVMREQASVRLRRLRALRRPLLVVATIAAAAGLVQAVRWGLGRDPLALDSATMLMVQVLLLSAIAAILAMSASYVLAPRADESDASAGAAAVGNPSVSVAPSRWRYAAATAFLVVGPITAIRFDPFSIGTLMLLTIGLLTFMLVVVAQARLRPVALPPAGFLFLLAWCTAVAGWSQRELRVEAFSLPLGLALLGAGIIALRPLPAPRPLTSQRATWTTWPNGFVGSWRVLAPGIVVTFLPLVLATGTDPQTWRAILVMSLALIAILVGSIKRLAAPFVLGLAVLPIEVIVVFTVQIGETINPLLWWITLAAVGAVLLVIAITSERKGTEDAGFTARMRDLG